MNQPQTIVRYGLAYVDSDGVERVSRKEYLHYATRIEANELLENTLKNNREENIRAAYGDPKFIKVVALDCYPNGYVIGEHK